MLKKLINISTVSDMAVLIDTGVFFGFYSRQDVFHMDAVALIIHVIEGKWGMPYISEHILSETINLLKYKISPETSMVFLRTFIYSKNLGILNLSEELLNQVIAFFSKNYALKGFSFTDAVSIVLLKEYNINHFVTFDRKLSKFAEIVGPGYFSSLTKEEKDYIRNIIEKYT